MATNTQAQHKYKDDFTKSNYKNPRVGQGSKTDTYGRWKMDGILNDKLLLMEGYARDGATEKQIADALGISQNTLINMKTKYGDVSEALRKGKEEPKRNDKRTKRNVLVDTHPFLCYDKHKG